MAKTQGRAAIEKESRKRGMTAAGAAVATGTLAAISAPSLALVGAGATGMLAYRWWKHRAKNGIKF